MPAKHYRLSPLAQADLEDIWLYTLQRWSADQADTYIGSLASAFEGLASGSKKGRPCDVCPPYQKYPCGSHMIYFLEYPKRVDIIRILHQRQDAGAHLDH